MKMIFVSFLIVFYLSICDAKMQTKCPESRTEETDRCTADGFFLLNPNFKGHGGKNIDMYCKPLTSSLQCIEKFNKECLKGFTKQAANAGLVGLRKHKKNVCGKDAPQKAEFLRKTKFITKKEIDSLYLCAQASIKNMNYISTSVQSNDQIPQSCCNYLLTRRCLSSKITKMTDRTNKQFIESMANEALGSLIDFLCSNYKDLKDCDAKMKEPMSRMNSTFRDPGTKQKFESYLIPFLDVLSD